MRQATIALERSDSHSDAPSKKLVVVIPAYNEQEMIGKTVGALVDIRESLPGIDLFIFVVDDGSTDNTGALAIQAGADRIVRHKVNQGLGAAVRSGFIAARNDGADLVVKFDADFQHNPRDLAQLISPLVEDSSDVVYGSRFQKISYRMPFVRRAGNLVFTGLMRWLTGWNIEDSQPGILAVNRSYLNQFYLPGNYNYTQQILLDSFHKGMRFSQVPVSFNKRETGKSFVSLKYPFKVFPQILMVLVGVKPLRVFGTLGLIFLLSGLCIFGLQFSQWLLGIAAKPVVNVNLVLGLVLFGMQTIFFGMLADLIVHKVGGLRVSDSNNEHFSNS